MDLLGLLLDLRVFVVVDYLLWTCLACWICWLCFTCLTCFTDLIFFTPFDLFDLFYLFGHSFIPFAGTVAVLFVRCNSKRAKSKIT